MLIAAQAGRRIGKLPVNFLLGADYDGVKPAYGGDWQLRSQVTLTFRTWGSGRRASPIGLSVDRPVSGIVALTAAVEPGESFAPATTAW